MEDDALEVRAPRVPNKVLHGFWSLLREEPDVDVTEGGVDGGGGGKMRLFGELIGVGAGGEGLFLARWFLVEDVPVFGFAVSRKAQWFSAEVGRKKRDAHSGPSRVNR